jgi:DNA-binding NarL/FixJ family response regulator
MQPTDQLPPTASGQPLRYALICDDHPVVARGLKELLHHHPLLDHCVTTHSPEECLDYIEKQGLPAVAIIDFWLKGEISQALLYTLVKKWPSLPLLVISADDDPMVQIKCQQWGAQGFINKQVSPGVVREAVSCLIQGLGWFMPIPAQDSSVIHRLPISAKELGLTPRQGQVLSQLLDGLPNKDIARQLFLSEATVKEHITGIFQRLGVKNRVEVISKLKHRCIEWSA